jgi:phosphoenolpyruvate carboxykinase (GTP)
LQHPPLIFQANWFRKDSEGKFLWPGFGDNMRVLKWIIDRCENRAGASETPIGYLPQAPDLDLDGLQDVSPEMVQELLAVDPEEWKKELAEHEKFFATLGSDLPPELDEARQALSKRLNR